jgi:hypothetical protein
MSDDVTRGADPGQILRDHAPSCPAGDAQRLKVDA